MNRPPHPGTAATGTAATGTVSAPQPYPEALIGRLQALTEALRVFDAFHPDRQSAEFTVATIRLLAASRDAVTAAAPVIADAAALAEALVEAADDCRDLPDWCRACRDAESEVCEDHQNNLTKATVYDHLNEVIFGPPVTGP